MSKFAHSNFFTSFLNAIKAIIQKEKNISPIRAKFLIIEAFNHEKYWEADMKIQYEDGVKLIFASIVLSEEYYVQQLINALKTEYHYISQDYDKHYKCTTYLFEV
jgi:hypothetical protein